MTLPKPNFSYAEYLKLPDDQRYEVLEGELMMTPAPGTGHQRVLVALTGLFYAYQRERGTGELLAAPCDVILSEQNVVQPDLLFIRQERLSIIQERGVFGAPDLVIEILSPSTAQRDQEVKRRLYSEHGVEEYWIVDPQARVVEVLTQQGGGLELWQRFEAGGSLRSPLLPGFELELKEIFLA